MTERAPKKLKVTGLFLSLGLVATIAAGCDPAPEGGEAVEGGEETIEEPVEETIEEPVEEGGEGGEGGEG